jgi:hypothetical protein
LKLARVPLNTVVEPEVTTRFILAHRSVAVPLAEPFADWVHVAPGFSVKVLAFAVPVFLIEIAVFTVLPGVIVVLPPNLLIVEQVAEFVETEPPSVLRQVTVAPAFCSCMISVPLPAVLLLFVMLAANPERVPVSERESRTAAKIPVRRCGAWWTRGTYSFGGVLEVWEARPSGCFASMVKIVSD